MSTRELGPDAPTRLAEQIPASDYFKTQIYYAEAIDKFTLIDCHATPTPRCRVAVKRLVTNQIAVERFRGQPYLGVVRILKRFRLLRSEWWVAGIIHSLV